MGPRLAAVLVAGALVIGTGDASARSGVSDPVYPELGSADIDVRHYDLDLSWFPATGTIDATAILTIKTRSTLNAFELDLVGSLAVSTVQVGGLGVDTTFSRDGRKLVVQTNGPVASGTVFTTKVEYAGRPTSLGHGADREGWLVKNVGAIVLGEPRGSMTWFPNNNTPSDKATYDVAVDVPSGYQAVSNGRNTAVVPASGRSTWHWTVPEPMATYLATVAIGKYTRHTRTVRGVRYDSFIAKEVRSNAEPLRLMPKVVRKLTEWFGGYPFDDAGMIVDNAPVFYALELQNRPFYPGYADTPTLVHELAHQWYGNSVTPRRWNHIWLNEGFATYAEWLWKDYKGGHSVRRSFRSAYDGFDAWRLAPLKVKRGTLFHETVYFRGAMTLQALRERIGTKPFFRLLRRWARENRYDTVTTGDFKRLAEEISGRQLDKLFKDWLVVAKKPRGYVD